jgi:hypothetical protein
MSQTLTVTFDGEAFYPESRLDLEPNKRYQIQILDEEKPMNGSEGEVERFLEEASRAFMSLRNDPSAWQEELTERQLWEGTLLDRDED